MKLTIDYIVFFMHLFTLYIAENCTSLPALSSLQQKKLRHLTIVSLSAKSKVGTLDCQNRKHFVEIEIICFMSAWVMYYILHPGFFEDLLNTLPIGNVLKHHFLYKV